MDAYAITKYIKQSSKKVRKTLKLVKGKNVVNDPLTSVDFM